MLRKSLFSVSAIRNFQLLNQRWVASFSTQFTPDIDSSKITVERTKKPKPKSPKEKLVFGKEFSDHMLEIDWERNKGWTAPRIIPYQDLQISPASSALHYGLQCFEGMKAYIDNDNKIRMFRPDSNMQRLNSSMNRLDLPEFNGGEFLKCIQQLLREDKDWIPKGMGYSLYIRPTAIATQPSLGVGPSNHAKLYVICSPVGPYYPEGFKPVKLLADPHHVRAWPGGTGNYKVGGNYAPTIQVQRAAAKRGYNQIMWLFGPDHHVTEVGTMNQFFFWKRRDGKKELITPPLDGTILPGVTRSAILDLTRSWKEFEVSERAFTIHEVIEAINENRLLESFGAGTAAIVSPVEGFEFGNKYYKVPLDMSDSAKQAGPLTARLADTIMGIQYGKIPHPWSVVVEEKPKK